MTPRVVLASGSPRRKVLLKVILAEFEVVVPAVDETLQPGDVTLALEEVAARKTAAVARPDAVVLAADTTVLLGNKVLGKPSNQEDAERMLLSLQGVTHTVVTAVALDGPHGHARFHVATNVTISLPDDTLAAYLESGNWQGKAGAYGIQDALITKHAVIQGDWSNVVGLPLHATMQALGDQGVTCQHPPSEEHLRAQNPF